MSASASKIGLVAGLLVLLLAGGEATAKRIALLDFRGPRSSRFQVAVGRIIGNGHTAIPSSRYKRVARRMRALRPTPRNVRRVARRLRVDGVVVGEVTRRRGRFRLVLRVRSGRTGRVVGRPIRLAVRRPRIVGRARAVLRRKLFRALRRLPPLGRSQARSRDRDRDRDRAEDRRREGEELPVEEEPLVEEGLEEERGRESDRESESERTRVAEADEARDREIEGEVEERVESEEESGVSAKLRADLRARSRGLDVEAGLAGTVRNLAFNVASDLGEAAPQGYKGGFVPAAFLSAELYPFAFDLKSSSPTRDIGVSAVYEKVLTIKSRVPNTDVVLPTSQQRYGIGLVYRLNFGDEPTSPTLKISARYNSQQFTLDRAPAQEMGIEVDVPNVAYTYIDPGLGGRYPVSEELALSAVARFLYVTGTGEMQQADQYGRGSVSGFDVDAHVEYRIQPRLPLRVGGHAIAFAYDFDGSGALTDRDGDMNQDVGGASDRYIALYATLGYLF